MTEKTKEGDSNVHNSDQAELLSLVKKGKAVWNKWAESNPKTIVDFTNVSFESDIGFREFIFPGDAVFNGATFKGDAGFRDATFKGDAVFRDATFKGDAWFSNATFKGDAVFRDATFKGDAVFRDATFKGYAGFGHAAFKGYAGFSNATFKSNAWFGNATFKGNAVFSNAAFKGDAWFSNATFKGYAVFSNATFKDHAWFNNATFKDDAWFEGATMGQFDLTAASFAHIPDFRGIPDTSHLRLDDVHFRLARVQDYPARTAQWATGISASDTAKIGKIRCLRGIAANTHNVDVERDLHILERSAELGSNWSTWWKGQSRPIRRAWRWWNAESTPEGEESTSILLLPKTLLGSVSIVLFRWSSYCGRSALLPAIWLVVATLCFYNLYSAQYDAQPNPLLPPDETRSKVLRAFTLANALPFGSAARPAYAASLEMLFGKGALLPFGFQMLSLLQGLTTVVLLFLVGLGLRNFFRMK